MLSVDERHALVLHLEAALHAVKNAAALPQRAPDRLDTAVRLTIEADNAQRHLYQLVNELTRWHDHPSVWEPAP